jgi:hypothetical protein
MSQEEKATLRMFCEAIECPVWKAIQQIETGKEQAPLRTHCSETCYAYKFNRWIGMTNKHITDLDPKERYK